MEKWKKLWQMIKELLGKNKELTEEAYIYTEDGLKEEIMESEESFAQRWTDAIYQKMEKTNFSFWYGLFVCLFVCPVLSVNYRTGQILLRGS